MIQLQLPTRPIMAIVTGLVVRVHGPLEDQCITTSDFAEFNSEEIFTIVEWPVPEWFRPSHDVSSASMEGTANSQWIERLMKVMAIISFEDALLAAGWESRWQHLHHLMWWGLIAFLPSDAFIPSSLHPTFDDGACFVFDLYEKMSQTDAYNSCICRKQYLHIFAYN